MVAEPPSVPGVWGWQDGKPPKVDWYYARRYAEQAHWRWWDGLQWSSPVPAGSSDEMAQRVVRIPALGRIKAGALQWWLGELGRPESRPAFTRCHPELLGFK